MKQPLNLPPSLDPAAGSRVLYRDAAGREHYARIVADLGGVFHAVDCLGAVALTTGDISRILSKP